ncbi:type II toxin-antitoxin system RelE/ParE family toxin [Novosphingobium sp.]|uniref:type II toxin-antitoxin system RelE/ParE family toxin n=1 Tax=Novosphingobium sp. TaxID=1874826 RepID=UPI003341AF6F
MKVVFALSAVQSLEQIGDYIARDNPARALSFIAELRRAALTLGQYPQRHPLVPRYERWGIRRRIHGKYLIFYRTEADRVVILQVVHGARDYARLLTGNEPA